MFAIPFSFFIHFGARRDPAGGRASRGVRAPANDITESARSSVPVSRDSVPIRGIPQAELLAQLQDQDVYVARRAFDTIYLALFERLWRFAYLTGRSRDIAQEATQDVFLTLWERRANLDIHGDISVYLHSAVRFRAAKYVRHERVVAGHAERSVMLVDEAETHHSIPVPDRVLDHAEFLRTFADILARIPGRARQALTLRWQEEWTYEEIGEALNISKVAARALILRYQRQLAPFLQALRETL